MEIEKKDNKDLPQEKVIKSKKKSSYSKKKRTKKHKSCRHSSSISLHSNILIRGINIRKTPPPSNGRLGVRP